MRGAIRIVAGLFALLWAVPDFGIIDLEVTVAPTDEWLPVALLDGGWGVFGTLLIAGGSRWSRSVRSGRWKARCSPSASPRSSSSPPFWVANQPSGGCCC